MDERSIRKDKELARAALKGLTIYGEQIARQGKADEVQQIRRIVDEISGYWGVDGRRDWTGEFDERIREVSQKRNVPQCCSNLMQLKAVKGLCRYAEEMAEVQGMEEIDWILEVSDVIRHMGQVWEMPQNEIDGVCDRIGDIAEGLQEVLQGMGIGFWQ